MAVPFPLGSKCLLHLLCRALEEELNELELERLLRRMEKRREEAPRLPRTQTPLEVLTLSSLKGPVLQPAFYLTDCCWFLFLNRHLETGTKKLCGRRGIISVSHFSVRLTVCYLCAWSCCINNTISLQPRLPTFMLFCAAFPLLVWMWKSNSFIKWCNCIYVWVTTEVIE